MTVTEKIAAKAREYASHYPGGTDARNTFIIFAEWVEALAAAEPSQPVDPDDKPIISLCLHDLITLAKADGVRSVTDPNYTDRSFVDEPSYRAIIAALTPTPSPTDRGAVEALRKIELWFFRDMSDEQRTKLFALFGMPVGEINNHGTQRIALRHVIAALALPAAEGGRLEDAARLIEDNIIKQGPEGKFLAPRGEGNQDGLFYATAIRALAAPSQAREGE